MSDIRWLTAFLDGPADSFGEATRFWQRVTGSGLSPYRGDRGQFATLLPPDGDPYLRVQLTDSGTAGQHLDLHVTDVDRATDRAVDLGAEVTFREPGLSVAVTPGGFAFCLVDHDGEGVRSRPVGRPGVLVDQLCLDIPADRYDSEITFWSDLTGWASRPGTLAEFTHLLLPEGLPLRVLLQRTGDGPEDPIRAHLDLTCADYESAVGQHETHGRPAAE